MGARQSHLNIILEFTDYKRNQLTEDKDKYTIDACKGLYTKCNDFEVVTYEIKHQGDATNYDLYIYNSKDSFYNDDYVFAYCSPTKNQVATQVQVYYSVLAPKDPLVITFVTNNGHHYHCPFDRLKSVGWDWASDISEYHNANLLDLLKKQYQKISWNKTIHFTKGKENKHVKVKRQEIDDYRYYRVILLPDEKDCALGSECLCYFNFENYKVNSDKPPEKNENKIDTYYLEPLFGKYYAGIILYFARINPINKTERGKVNEKKDYENTLLLVEFIHSCETISLKRKDKDCCWWDREQVEYMNLYDRFKKLENIKEAQSAVIKTIFLDQASTNVCHEKVEREEQTVYNKYKYKFASSEKIVFLFERKKTDIGTLTKSELKAKDVEVYYLKVKGAKDGEQDPKPFLIVIDKEANGKPKTVYHFKYGLGFDKWEQFEKVEQIQGKLEEIDKTISCSFNIDLLRKMVYDILTRDKPPPPPEAPPDEKEERPPTLVPETRPDGLSLFLIIGGSVGGVLLILGLAIGYGVYWYNTTIKLLT